MPEKHSLAHVLSSSGRIKILTLLSQAGELHLTEIARRTDQSYASADRHLQDLSDAMIVEERDYGRVRMFKLNMENPRTKMLRDLILLWDNNPGDTRVSWTQA